MTQASQPGIRALTISSLLAVAAVFTLVAAYSYSRASGVFPIFVGWIFLALTLLESALQLKVIVQNRQRRESDTIVAAVETTRSTWQEFVGPLWLGAFLLLTYVLGLLLATPIFMFAFLRFSARREVLQSATIALLGAAFIYGVFTLLLNYRLYAGVLFGA